MNKDLNIKDFVSNMEQKLNINKKISLYDLVKKNCPELITDINNKIYGSTKRDDEKDRWYSVILNYLTKQEVLSKEDTPQGIYHNVELDYQKYFIVPKSTIYSNSNNKEHLILYKEAALEFLEKTQLKEKSKTKEKKDDDFLHLKSFFKKHPAVKFIIASILLFFFALNTFRLIGREGFQQSISILMNSIMLSISILFYVM